MTTLVCGMIPPGGDIPGPIFLCEHDTLTVYVTVGNLVHFHQVFEATGAITIEFEHMRIKRTPVGEAAVLMKVQRH